MIKKLFSVLKAPCGIKLEGAEIEYCKNQCAYFNGLETDSKGIITGVDCLYSEIPKFSYHILSFKKGNKLYKVKRYDETKDGPLKEPYNYCEKCCFNKTLSNGEDICLLGFNTNGASGFVCYAGEIWEEVKNE